jgi:hypothetical protein
MQIQKGRNVGWLAALVLGLQTLFGRAVLVAQDIQVDVNPQRGGGGTPWYGMWWVWVLAAVFIIVIVALTTRGSGRTTA